MRLDASDGELLIRTGVAGRAARMGHRLTIVMNSWQAEVSWAGDEPEALDLTVEVDSLRVRSGEGGVTPLTDAEKAVVRSNALKSLEAKRFPHIRFRSADIEKTGGGYRLAGALSIRGTTANRVIDLGVEDGHDHWRLSCQSDVSQAEFGVKPYSAMLGTLKVADVVTVSFTADVAKGT